MVRLGLKLLNTTTKEEISHSVGEYWIEMIILGMVMVVDEV